MWTRSTRTPYLLMMICCALLSQTGTSQSAAASVHKSGEMEMLEHCAADLDAGNVVCTVVLDGDGREPPSHPSGKHYEFRFEPKGSERYFEPRGSAGLSEASTARRGVEGCASTTYRSKRVRVDNLTSGSFLCVKTDQNRFAELELRKAIGPNAKRAEFSYMTWER